MRLKERIYFQELLEQFKQQIINDWEKKWTAHGLEFVSFATIPNKAAFVDDLMDDLDATIYQKLGTLAYEKGRLPSKDFLRRHIFERNSKDSFYLHDKKRETLCLYLGYESWDDFKAKNKPTIEQEPITVNIIQIFNSLLPGVRNNQLMLNEAQDWEFTEIPPKPKYYQVKYWLLGLLLLGLLSFGCVKGIDWWQNRPFTAEQLAGVKFYIAKENGKGLPHEIYIAYDISSLGDLRDAKICLGRQEDYYLNQLGLGLPNLELGEVSEVWKTIHDNKGLISHVYYLPNIVRIKLSIRGQVIQSFVKIIESNNKWLGNAKSHQNKWESYAYPEEWLIKNGEISMRRELLENPRSREDYLPSLFLIKPFEVDGDEVFVEIRIKDPMDLTGIRCLGSLIQLKSTDEKTLGIVYSSKGCSAYSKIFANRSVFNGINWKGLSESSYELAKNIQYKTVDLSFLGINDLQEYSVFGIKTVNHEVIIYINGRELFRSKYLGDFSNIAEIRIESKVSSYIDWVKLSNSKTGKVVFFDDFIRDYDNKKPQ